MPGVPAAGTQPTPAYNGTRLSTIYVMNSRARHGTFHRLESAATWFLPHAHLALLAIALLAGLLTVGDYGESWDERDLRRLR